MSEARRDIKAGGDQSERFSSLFLRPVMPSILPRLWLHLSETEPYHHKTKQ